MCGIDFIEGLIAVTKAPANNDQDRNTHKNYLNKSNQQKRYQV